MYCIFGLAVTARASRGSSSFPETPFSGKAVQKATRISRGQFETGRIEVSAAPPYWEHDGKGRVASRRRGCATRHAVRCLLFCGACPTSSCVV